MFFDKISQHFCIFILKYSKNQQLFWTKIITKLLKNFEWINSRVGFFTEKMANQKAFTAKVCKTYRQQHFIHKNS